METELNEYDLQANNFAEKFGVKMQILNVSYRKHFPNDTEKRYVFTIRLKRNGKQYTFNFGQSIAQRSNEPSLYSVLTCLQKYDVGSFENFCSDFGYDFFEKQSKIVYKNLCHEYRNVERLFTDCLDELSEIL
jgi:hypothetical protein